MGALNEDRFTMRSRLDSRPPLQGSLIGAAMERPRVPVDAPLLAGAARTIDSITIEFGCGRDKMPGALGVDINPRSAADVIHDMNVFPYPLEDDIADRIVCHDVLEHVDHFVETIEELWRIGRDGCRIEVTAPFMSSVNYHSDPTHRRAFTSRSFDYFIDGTDVRRHAYSSATLQLDSVAYDPLQARRRPVERWLLRLANRHKRIYEERFAFIYPVHQIHFDLTVLKSVRGQP